LARPIALNTGALAADGGDAWGVAGLNTRCITSPEAFARVEWKAIILIGSMVSLGTAMEHTGAAKYLALQLVSFTGSTDPLWLLTVFFALTVFLTQPMSNQAAATGVAGEMSGGCPVRQPSRC
jgi:di/tricarboxylate transporter